MHSLRRLSLLIFLLLTSVAGIGLAAQQTVNTDSLRRVVDAATVHDTVYLDQMKTLIVSLFQVDPPTALEYSLLHLQYADSLHDQRRTARGHNMAGNLYKTIGLFGLAIKHFMEALRIYEELGDQLWISNLHSNLGSAYESEGRMEDALAEQLKALRIRQDNGISQGIDGVMGAIGNIYGSEGQNELALQYYRAAIDSAVAQGNIPFTGVYYGNAGNVYGRMKDFPKALAANHHALGIHKLNNDQVSVCRVMHNIGVVHLLTGKTDSALKYQLDAYRLAESLNVLPVMRPAAEQLIFIYDTLGQHEPAVDWARIEMRLADSLQRQQQLKESHDAELKYRLEQEEREREYQQEKDDLKQKVQEKRQQVIQIALTAGLLLLLALVVVLSVMFRQKRNASRLLESKVAQRTQQLSRSNDQLSQEISEKEKARVELREFIYKSSHDLKGPLTSIQGLVQVANTETPGSTYLPMIEHKVGKLDRVLQQLIDKAELEGHMTQPTQLSLEQLVRELPSFAKGVEKAESVIFDWHLQMRSPVLADAFLLRIALKQLLLNAIDFGPAGQMIRISVTGTADRWRISISDQGPGISPDSLQRVGELFFRGTPESKGAGLGLYLAKEALSRMNMALQLEPLPEGGITATISTH